MCAWNQKNLDYEIETNLFQNSVFIMLSSLEIKRTSITRLKPYVFSDKSSIKIVAWNQKNLDYEIETICGLAPSAPGGITWNQKNLDYEIETGSGVR